MATAPLGIITLDGNKYVTRGPIIRTPRNPVAVPPATPQSGRPTTDNYLSHHILEQRGPLGIGSLNFFAPGFVADLESICSWFPGLLCPGPLKNTPTQASPPTTFKILGEGFTEANANLFMYGSVANSGQQPLWYLNGTTLTSCALNGVATIGDQVKIVGVGVFGGTYYAIGNQLVSNGTWDRVSYVGTALATWAQLTTAGASETLAAVGGADSLMFLDVTDRAGAVYLNSLGYNSTTFAIQPQSRPVTAATTAWTEGLQQRGGTALATVAAITDSDAAPRGFLPITAGDGGLDYLVSTNRGLFHINMAATAVVSKVVTYRNPSGAYTGRMCMGGDGKVYFADGATFGRFWFEAGTLEVHFDYPEEDEARAKAGGLQYVAAKQGHVTDVRKSAGLPAVYVARGGLAANKDGWVGMFDWKTGLMHCPYQNTTAQRAIMACIEFSDDLWIAEESAAAGNQSGFYFTDITTSPDNNSSYAFAATGSITTSRFDGYLSLLQKGFLKKTILADTLTSTEKITGKFAKNGGSLKTGQDITASPGSVWMDMISGTHTGANNASVLTDSTASFLTDGVQVGDTISNTTDGSTATITAVTATTITGTLSGGTQNDWDTGEAYTIIPARGLDAYDVYSELTLARGATTTLSPKIRAFSTAYVLRSPKKDELAAVISLDSKDYQFPGSPTVDSVLSNLSTTFARGRLVKLTYTKEGTSTVTVVVRVQPYALAEQPLGLGERGAFGAQGPPPDLKVTFEEVI